MKARYQYRFYPTDQQQQSLAQLFGCCRVVWNDALALCKQSEKLPGLSKLSAMLTQAKKTEERKWLADVSSVPLQQSLRNLDVAYRNFFNSRNGKRKGRKMGVPRFKKKTNQQSAEFTARKLYRRHTAVKLAGGEFWVKDGEVYLAKIGNLNPIWSRELPSEPPNDSEVASKSQVARQSPQAGEPRHGAGSASPSSVTVIKDCAGRYFLSFVVEIKPGQIDAKNQGIGIDLGIKTNACDEQWRKS